MKNKLLRLICLLMAAVLAFAVVGCGGTQEDTPPNNEQEEEDAGETIAPPTYAYGDYADLEKIVDFSDVFVAENWSTTVEKYLVVEDGFLTLHPGTTQAVLKDYNFENGSFEFQIKPNMKGDAVCFVLCLQNDDYSEMNYSAGMKNYTIVVNDDGNVELVKYMGKESSAEDHAVQLMQSENIAASLASGASFVPCKIDLITTGESTQIVFSIGKTIAGKLVYEKYIDYTDAENAYQGGRFAFATMNGAGLAAAYADADTSLYVQPALPPFEAIEVQGVPVYTGTEPLTLFAGAETPEATLEAFEDGWSGRNGIFKYEASGKTYNGKYGVRLLPSSNAEEGGKIEFVGHYNKYIFDQVQFDIKFSIDKMEFGWIMFWFKLLSETQNVSAWGNKYTREASQCYMTYLDYKGDMHFNKWTDWQQFFLGESTSIRRQIDPQDVDIVKHIRLYVEYAKLDPASTEEYDSVSISVALVEENGEIPLKQYQDSNLPLLNPGFFGLQTFAGDIMTVYEITATPLV